jgi:hypothetical protein
MSKRRLIAALPVLLLVAWGCGSKSTTSEVTGKVTYQNTPVPGGQITFYPAKGVPMSVGIDPDGSYTITDLEPGEVTVTVSTESLNPDKKTPEYGGRGRGGASPPPPNMAGGGGGGKYVKIPDKYAKQETSGLKTTVTKGKNKYDVPLTD